MTEIAVYDPAVAERAMDAMTDRMIAHININHDMLKIAHRIHLRENHLKRRIDIAEQRVCTVEKKLHHERKKAKIRARRSTLVCSVVLGVAARFAHVALENGLTSIDVAMPLALGAAVLAGWAVCCWWHDFKGKKV